MGLSGRIGAAASGAVDDLIVQQLAQRRFEEQLRAQQAQEQMQREQMASTERQRAQQIEEQQRTRREAANARGVAEMNQQAEIMGQQDAQRRTLEGLQRLSADPSLPEPVRKMIELRSVGVQVSPDALEDPAARQQRDVSRAGAIAEAQAKAAAKYRSAGDGTPDQEWVLRGGQPVPIAKGTARPGDLPYERGANQSGPKLSAGAASAVADAKTSLETLDALDQLYSDAYIGPVAGRANQMRSSLPEALQGMSGKPQGFERFAAEAATLKNSVIRAITGAAVSAQEQDRIMGQIPDVNDTPAQWRAKVDSTRRNLQSLVANNLGMAGSTAEAPAPQTITAPGQVPEQAGKPQFRFNPATGKVEPVR